MITTSYFYNHVGRSPEMDDLERCNCQKQGEAGHWMCGWNFDKNKPVFLSGLPENEVIQSVAIRYTKGDDTVILWAPKPFRHHDIIAWYGATINRLRLREGYIETQGFLTNSGKFVDREEGLIIAQRNNQILEKSPPKYKLFSEDMW